MDIIAVFPFFLLFRLIEEALLFFRVSQEVSEGQKFLHLGVEAEKIAKEERALRELSALQKESRVFMEIEEGTKLSRTRMFARFLRLPRLIIPRLTLLIPFFASENFPLRLKFRVNFEN